MNSVRRLYIEYVLSNRLILLYDSNKFYVKYSIHFLLFGERMLFYFVIHIHQFSSSNFGIIYQKLRLNKQKKANRLKVFESIPYVVNYRNIYSDWSE